MPHQILSATSQTAFKRRKIPLWCRLFEALVVKRKYRFMLTVECVRLNDEGSFCGISKDVLQTRKQRENANNDASAMCYIYWSIIDSSRICYSLKQS